MTGSIRSAAVRLRAELRELQLEGGDVHGGQRQLLLELLNAAPLPLVAMRGWFRCCDLISQLGPVVACQRVLECNLGFMRNDQLPALLHFAQRTGQQSAISSVRTHAGDKALTVRVAARQQVYARLKKKE